MSSGERREMNSNCFGGRREIKLLLEGVSKFNIFSKGEELIQYVLEILRSASRTAIVPMQGCLPAA